MFAHRGRVTRYPINSACGLQVALCTTCEENLGMCCEFFVEKNSSGSAPPPTSYSYRPHQVRHGSLIKRTGPEQQQRNGFTVVKTATFTQVLVRHFLPQGVAVTITFSYRLLNVIYHSLGTEVFALRV